MPPRKHIASVLRGKYVYLQINNFGLLETLAPTKKLAGYKKVWGNVMALAEHGIVQCFFSLMCFFMLSNFFSERQLNNSKFESPLSTLRN